MGNCYDLSEKKPAGDVYSDMLLLVLWSWKPTKNFLFENKVFLLLTTSCDCVCVQVHFTFSFPLWVLRWPGAAYTWPWYFWAWWLCLYTHLVAVCLENPTFLLWGWGNHILDGGGNGNCSPILEKADTLPLSRLLCMYPFILKKCYFCFCVSGDAQGLLSALCLAVAPAVLKSTMQYQGSNLGLLRSKHARQPMELALCFGYGVSNEAPL